MRSYYGMSDSTQNPANEMLQLVMERMEGDCVCVIVTDSEI